ncbi:hypothetical protein [Celeribacter sp.]|uniref:hypothetical protein n=1 Tax=Celeribacter sp. TaxID=1890673 RepID=UPI003A8DC1F8
MVTDSKILTVSYGTFSCTLEGFDDPFNTMRSIAEYFRDLASEDRYFGAEPPTPDPQMLQSIAEREIQRRVETKMEENGMILRQVEGAPNGDIAAPAPQAPLTTAPITKAPVPSTAPEQTAAAEAAPAAASVAAPVEAPKQDDAPVKAAPAAAMGAAATAGAALAEGSIAEKLARIRAAVAKRDEAPFAEDQHAADAFGAEDAGDTEDLVADIQDQDTADLAPVEEIVAADETDESHDDVEAVADPEATVSEDMIADAQDEATTANVTETTDDEIDIDAVMETATLKGADESDVLIEADETTVDDEAASEETDSADAIAEDETLDDAIASDADTLDDSAAALHEMDPNLAADIAEATSMPEVEDAPAPQDPLTRVRARVIKMRRADYEAEIAEQQAAQQNAANATETSEDEMLVDEEVAETDAADAVAAIDDDQNQTDDEAIYTEDLEEAETDHTESDPIDLTSVLRRELGSSSLSEDDEDDLMRELAAVAAESMDAEIIAETTEDIASDDTETETDTGIDVAAIADDLSVEEDTPSDDESADTAEEVASSDAEPADVDDADTLDNIAALLNDTASDGVSLEDETFDAEEDDAETTSDSDATRNIFSASADDNMSRILDETEREMEKDDTSRRRSAIQHLKAAVMSKRADRAAGNTEDNDDEESNIYRKDLESIVRPKRPERVKGSRRDLPPLMLVSEQRIDTPQDVHKGADISPVRPRRISAAAVALSEEAEVSHDDVIADATGFADYAETMGAQGLSELLEAAAAYANHVEGKKTVSRPQIMRLAAEAMPDEQPLEERLRSFGQLLRQGKIKKIARGQFQVSDASRFKPETRAHG